MVTASTPDLLGLPAEIRNMIYRYAIVDDKSLIEITKHLKQPPLLSVNRLIRSETLVMWYCENVFDIRILDCDAMLLQAWNKNVNVVLSQTSEAIQMPGLSIIGRPHWANLVSWCRLPLTIVPGTKENPKTGVLSVP